MARMPGLDLLRALAIVWVMLFHSFIVGGLGEGWEWLSRYGWMGVDLFFVLSGYLIGGQVLQGLRAHGRLDLGGFYLRRAFRILPAFWVVLAVYELFPGLREAQGLESGWKFALFIFNLDVDYAHHPAFSHAWSLCVEEQFYLLFPLLAAWLFRRNSSVTSIALILLLLLLLAGVALRSALWLHDAPHPAREWFIEDLYYPTWCRLDGLLVGVSLAALRVFRPQRWQSLRHHANLAVVLGLALLAVSFGLHAERTSLLANSIGWPVLSLALGLLVFAAAERDCALGSWKVPGAGWIATASYSLYLSHKLAMHAVDVLLEDRLHGAPAFAVYVLAILAAGAGLALAVELPSLRLRERWLRWQRSASAPPSRGQVGLAQLR